ncbi:hypothetical protein GCM10010520_54970 [Rhizobium viscosum]|uniref:Uncharacterized protein n=1 Tax=Rhizobium viscosum TaxID=1673 RepID=A0ABR9IZQ8_RHIVS|nr:hypothetical protein [Rhizobium viscosum]MBE1508704.1 hypothetical protein [Rhizobium viscosum]
MTETFAARAQLDRARTEADTAQARADEQLAVVRRLQDAMQAADPHATQELFVAATAAHARLQQEAHLRASLARGAEDALTQAMNADAALFADRNTDPIALLPVRVETIWWEPHKLRVRVYPDDILMPGSNAELTPAEADAGAEYWRAPGPEAWRELLKRLRPARAAWAVRACRPGSPPPTVRSDGEGDRRVRTLAMPKKWRFIGLLGGEVVVDKLGRTVPDPLPVGLLRSDEEEGWETDWFAALRAGMAVELTLNENDRLDELLVVGVRDGSATDGAAQLRDLLLGHMFGSELGMLPAGTPTNNTPRARSAWSSVPACPEPDPEPPAAGRPVADALAAALGLPDAGFLRNCPGADDAEPSAVEALSLLTWPTLGKGFTEAAVSHLDLGSRQTRSTDPARPWRGIRDHLAEHVRGRGPLPTVRVGRQPYGVLPATALSDWQAERNGDVDGLLAPWLLRLRERWRAILRNDDIIPKVRPGEPVDQVVVDVLQRLPVATGLAMRRMDGPGFAVPRIPRDQPPANLDLPGLSPDGTLRWTTRSDGWTDLGWGLDDATGAPAFVPRLTPDPVSFPIRALNTADYLGAVRTFLSGELAAADYDRSWPVELSSGRETPPRPSTFFHLPSGRGEMPNEEEPAEGEEPHELPPEESPDASGLLDALLFLPNWTFMDGDDGEDDPLRQALAVTGEVDQLVADVLEGLSERERTERVAAVSHAASALPRLEQAFRTIAAVPVTRLPELLLEVIDVYSHRLDAWVTSLASRRLAQLREAGVDGVRLGCYGWVENLAPPVPRETVEVETEDGAEMATVSEKDGYIHAPSLQHAATAAVLRSGFIGNPDNEAYAVNLNSRRTRIARWLLGAVRRGQNLGSLLGYRFERSLHDANLDHLIERFRRQFPLPAVPEPEGEGADGDLWARSTEIIAARNVVDGMALVRAGPGVIDMVPEADRPKTVALLRDLADALDAVGDLVLAESVHQLVGGSPIRAGLAADTLGRGEDVPDTFQMVRTPHRARALTHRLAVLLPAQPSGSTGWPTDDPVAALDPGLEAWIAHLLGPAAGWTLSGVLLRDPRAAPEAGEAFNITADRLGLGALSTLLDAAGADHARLNDAVRRVFGAAPGVLVTFAGDGWTDLRGRALRIRSLLATAQPLLPAHLPGRPGNPVDVADLRERLARFADPRLVASHPGAAALRTLATDPLGPDGTEGWLSRARTALAEVLGTNIPLLPALAGPSPRRSWLRREVSPSTMMWVCASGPGARDLPGAMIEDWLRHNAKVRPVARTLHESLLVAGTRAGRVEPLRAAQDPQGEADPWIGGAFTGGPRPQATAHLVWHAPLETGDAAFTGLLLDEWIELLPGLDLPGPPGPAAANLVPETELTGVAFHYDRPDAKAPHSLLIAVPPDLDRGWTSDGLVQVLRETLELAKLRAIDLADLPLLDDLIPAIRISSNGATGQALSRIETRRPNTDPQGPFRFEPGHRTDGVEAGLAARIHDPLWLLTRQWQFGEFAAEDAGSPAVVRMAGESTPIDAWRPAGRPDWMPYDIRLGPLDAQVEDEPVAVVDPRAAGESTVKVDERLRAEGGAMLLRMLDDAGFLSAATAVLAAHRLPADRQDTSLLGLLDGLLPDAQSVAAALDAGTFAAEADPRLGEIARGWRVWWINQLSERGPDCFDEHRFEHAAEVSTGGSVLLAEEYLGDGLDWYSLDVHPDPEIEAAPPAPPRPFVHEGLPSLIYYGGLPADRFWEMEDSRVDLGAMELSTLDTGRLLLISFATVYGNDWFLVPLEVPAGSLTVLDQVLVRDVFGRLHKVERAGREDPSWSLFTLHSPDPDHRAASGLLMLPTERGQTGAPLESVVLARDELANLAWAVQHLYTDGRGEIVERRDQWMRQIREPAPVGELPTYRVQTEVPDYWLPLVPEALRPGVTHFRLATLTGPGLGSRLEGRLLRPRQWIYEEEVPRDGVRLTRRPVLARWFDGSSHVWIRREKTPGTGEISSGLAFDTVRPTEPWPR